MKHRALTAMALAAGLHGLGAQQPIHAGYRVTAEVSMRIWVPSGLVRVIAWDRDSIDVTGVTGKRGKYFGGGSRDGAKLGIESINSRDTLLAGGELTVHVPRRARVWIKMTLGHIDVEGTQGELEAYVVGGTVAVRDAKGVVAIDAIDAPVRLDRVSGSTRIHGGAGMVVLADVAGTATVSTVSGGVMLTGRQTPAARIETIGGAIDAFVSRDAPDLDLTTHSGSVSLVVPSSAAPALDLATRSGKVSNPFGRGGPHNRVVVRSFKGDINVRGGGGIEEKR